ncbi:MAG: GMP synthase (glutamine-hydrolyzing), partial [Gammaproteobacteria bacterium]
VIDFGSQYTQLIARNVREAGVYCEIYPFDVAMTDIVAFNANGIVLSGGPESVTTEDTPRAHKEIFELGVPVLGVCYGMQTMAAQLGGEVENSEHKEYGHAKVELNGGSKLFEGIKQSEIEVWMSHGDRVSVLPAGFKLTGQSSNAPHAAFADESRNFYGIQFHPEVTHTKDGKAILNNFVHSICGCASDWQPSNIIERLIEDVRQQVGDDEVILGLSGGVDSSVVAALLHRAIGDKLTCIFVDNGLLRLNEGDEVMKTFADNLGVKVIRVDAEEEFLSPLIGEDDPEAKRKIIGNQFITIFEREARKLEKAKWLAQGTIYPDVIESAGNKLGKAKVIKSHHNVGGLPDDMELGLVEPLRDLFKDEVRKVGLALGLPEVMVFRHPFPGPGLGVRILGEVKKEFADILRQADAIFLEELYRHDLYHKISQAFAVFLPVKSVGVVGDNRAYEYVIALRAVETIDFMTAIWSHIPYDVLGLVSNRIINEVRGVSRVTYDISGKPPATIEWE